LKEEENNIEVIIGKFLAGEASADETMMVHNWRSASSENEKVYRQVEYIFDNAAKSLSSEKYDADAAWEKVKSQLNEKKIKQIGLPATLAGWATNPVLRVAASLLLIATVGLTLYLTQKEISTPKAITLVSFQTILQDTLLNHVPVALNKHTELVATIDEEKNKAAIVLKGEASFNVLPEFKGELIVQAEETLIQHMGTHFNVKAYTNEEIIEVSVFEGKVHFFTHDSEGIFIEPGGKGIYNKVKRTFTSSAANKNTLAYQSKYFVFESNTLADVVDQLNSVYEQKIVIAENLKPCLVTVDFDDEDIATIADVLAETLGLTVTKTTNEIKLNGNGCR
jgi:transmembrane sensor